VVNPKKVFTQIKGFSTAKNMFRTLYENNGSTIIFDDCDSILKDAIAINILKAALDSYDKRVITWVLKCVVMTICLVPLSSPARLFSSPTSTKTKSTKPFVAVPC
jgi:hypothetical protein